MARKPTPAPPEGLATPRPAAGKGAPILRADDASSAPAGNGSEAERPSRVRVAPEARKDLLERATRNAAGVVFHRSDPLADAKAARRAAEIAAAHEAELSRRGLSPSYAQAALQLAAEIEDHLQALPAAAVSARARSPEEAELLADAAVTAQAAREAILRVTRGADGRRAAHAFGLGEPFSARQPQHVLRALRRILDAARTEPSTAADAGLIPEDLQTMRELAEELAKLPGVGAPMTDEAEALRAAQGALRAFFDLLAAKATLALLEDPEERARLLSILPRAEERRHARRAESVPAA